MPEADQGDGAGGAPVTTPGGVPNLPVGALTLETLAENLQDMSGTAMKKRAVERFPSIMDSSTGLSPALDVTPFGILTSIYSEVNSLVATADPADINGPEDIPQLLVEFIEGLPVVGQFIDLLQAILGNYDGDDEILLAIQRIFAPIRKLVELVSGAISGGFPTIEEITEGWNNLGAAIEDAVEGIGDLAGMVQAGFTNIFDGWFGGGGSGTPEEVQQTIVAIKDAVAGGFTIHTFTSSNTAWTLPAGVALATGIVIGGGGRGFNGGTGSGTQLGGAPGKSGGYLAQDLDLSGLTPGTSQLNITVGAGGTNPGDDGQLSSIKVVGSGVTLLSSEPNVNGITDLRGLLETPSRSGRGGRGGGATSSGGDDGENAPDTTALGGTGGTGGSGNGTSGSGTAGGPGDVASPVKRGGAGGGGGGGRGSSSGLITINGGNGGPGGYPGGAGGGGGAVCAPVTAIRDSGTGGFGAIGLVVILTKGS